MSFNTSPERLDLVDKIVKFLREIPQGGTFTYIDLHGATGARASKDRVLIYRAMKRVNDIDGAVFMNMFGVGYKRAEPESIHLVGVHARGCIRRKAKRTGKRMRNAVTKSNSVDPKTNLIIGTEIALLGLIGRAAEDRTVDMVRGTEGYSPETQPKSMRDFANYLAGSM